MRLLFLLLIACQEKELEVREGPTATPSASAPIDHLAEGELIEGTEKAFSLVLPRGMLIKQTFVDIVYVEGPQPTDAVANYVRARVRDGATTAGATGTVFDRVRLPADPDLYLTINVHARPSGGTMMEVRNATKPKSPDLPDEAARWRAAGLRPGGGTLDPKRMQ